MKALVTGGDGFIGSHLVEHLLEQDYEVRALAQYNSLNSWGWLEDIARLQDVEVVTGDVRDPALCRSLVKGVEVVFHLAALIAIPYSYLAPDTYVDTNVRGTLNVCQAVRDAGMGRLIHTSTSEVYGTAQYVPIDERHPLQPQSPYSASKIGADAMAMSFYNSFDVPVTIARPFNTYGPRQSARAVIPTIIGQIASGSREIRLGDVSPTRDFNFVKDICRGFVTLARCDKAVGKTVNIGSNSEISIGELFALIRELMGSDVHLLNDSQRLRPSRSEVFRLRCDNTLIRELTGYRPEWELRRGLRTTIDWYLKPQNLAKYKMGLYNL